MITSDNRSYRNRCSVLGEAATLRAKFGVGSDTGNRSGDASGQNDPVLLPRQHAGRPACNLNVIDEIRIDIVPQGDRAARPSLAIEQVANAQARHVITTPVGASSLRSLQCNDHAHLILYS